MIFSVQLPRRIKISAVYHYLHRFQKGQLYCIYCPFFCYFECIVTNSFTNMNDKLSFYIASVLYRYYSLEIEWRRLYYTEKRSFQSVHIEIVCIAFRIRTQKYISVVHISKIFWNILWINRRAKLTCPIYIFHLHIITYIKIITFNNIKIWNFNRNVGGPYSISYR